MKFMDQATQNTHMQFTYIFEGHNHCKAAIWHNFRNTYLCPAVARSTLQYVTPFTYYAVQAKDEPLFRKCDQFRALHYRNIILS
jgi:hypothetical protein